MVTEKKSTPNKRKQQHDATLIAIREAADELVNEVGFEDMRVIDIATKAGISKSNFYHYFKSKNDILKDRYHRTNTNSYKFYDALDKEMHEVDKLKCFVEHLCGYIQNRVPKMLVAYVKHSFDSVDEWRAEAPESRSVLLSRIVSDGFKKGHIKEGYTQEEIIQFINMCTRGSIMSNVMDAKASPENKTYTAKIALPVLLSWIENLRA